MCKIFIVSLYVADGMFIIKKVLCVFRITITIFIVSKMFAVSCVEGSLSLPYVLQVTVWAGQLINAAFVIFSRCSGGLVCCCVLSRKFSGGIFRLIYVYVGIFE